MKIRMQENSIRLRLTQTEVRQVAKGKKIQETVGFGESNPTFRYAIQYKETDEIQAGYSDHEIMISLPVSQAIDWANSEQVGLERKIPLTENQYLYILVEKDFQCLHKRPTEDETDHFPNPEALS